MSAQSFACAECGMVVPGHEYHPYAFCVLYKAGLNPWRVVDDAVREMGKHGSRSGPK